MKFTPKTDQEIQEAGLWNEGTYDFEIVGAEETISKSSGNDMLVLDLKLFKDESTKTVKDYITSTQDYKLKAACKATGLLEKYDSGEVGADDFDGKIGKLFLTISPAKDGYAAKNNVKNYVEPAEDLEDSIVF